MAIKAATADRAAGQTYNCCTAGDITQQELIETLCELLHVPPVKRHLPIWLAHRVAFGFELFGKAIGQKQTPPLTRHALSVFVRPTTSVLRRPNATWAGGQASRRVKASSELTKWLETAAPELFQAR